MSNKIVCQKCLSAVWFYSFSHYEYSNQTGRKNTVAFAIIYSYIFILNMARCQMTGQGERLVFNFPPFSITRSRHSLLFLAWEPYLLSSVPAVTTAPQILHEDQTSLQICRVHYRHEIFLISRMRVACYWFCWLHSVLGSVGQRLYKKKNIMMQFTPPEI